jgi:hypothetical protein
MKKHAFIYRVPMFDLLVGKYADGKGAVTPGQLTAAELGKRKRSSGVDDVDGRDSDADSLVAGGDGEEEDAEGGESGEGGAVAVRLPQFGTLTCFS